MLAVVISIILVVLAYIVYKKLNKPVRTTSNAPQHDHVIIVGNGIGGMVTAGYLSRYFKRITIIESDDVLSDVLLKSTSDEMLDYRLRLESPTSIGRSGIPQMYQLHIVEGEGFHVLTEVFPQLEKILRTEHDIRTYSLKKEAIMISSGVTLHSDLSDELRWLGVDRFTLETVLRRELYAKYGSKIEWKCNSRVLQLISDQSSNTVLGVKYRCKQDATSTLIDLYGDFIVDCTGRNGSSAKWLKQSFDINVPTEDIHFGNGYVSFVIERFKSGDPSLDEKAFICSTVNTPQQNTACCISPIRQIKTTEEDSLGSLSSAVVLCVNSEFPPNDSYENIVDWAKDNVDPRYHTILQASKLRSPIVPYRRATDHRKYLELIGKKWPQNYILLGDAICTFNPQYGQGMTHACRHARALNKVFSENPGTLKNLPHKFIPQAAKISDECWLTSTTNDWKTPTLRVVKSDLNGQVKTYHKGEDFTAGNNNAQARPPLRVRFLQWYSYWFLQCAKDSAQLSTDYLSVVNQHKDPLVLVKPGTLYKVLSKALFGYFSSTKN